MIIIKKNNKKKLDSIVIRFYLWLNKNEVKDFFLNMTKTQR